MSVAGRVHCSLALKQGEAEAGRQGTGCVCVDLGVGGVQGLNSPCLSRSLWEVRTLQ